MRPPTYRPAPGIHRRPKESTTTRPARALLGVLALAPLALFAAPADAGAYPVILIENCLTGATHKVTVSVTNGVPKITVVDRAIQVPASLGLVETDEAGWVFKARQRTPARKDYVAVGESDPRDRWIDGTEDENFENKKSPWPDTLSIQHVRALEYGVVKAPHTLNEQEIVIAALGGCEEE